MQLRYVFSETATGLRRNVSMSIALIVTSVGNVPINIWQGRVDTDDLPADFERRRRRWDLFQMIRGSLQLLGFVLVAIGTAAL